MAKAAALLALIVLVAGSAASGAMAQDPAARPAGGQRAVTATGVTKPPGAAERTAAKGAPFSKAGTEAAMLKAQREAAARDKAWDAKMRTTMGSICKGC
ncbi:hypothetical protein ASG40_02540 [Methylobacterium sp. Leaf399]|uniref:hypothetical protein n=1 Tax=unclassified Methylobacterium TaxID=2615210 RepID=UPI0006F2D3B6|nr:MULTISPECIES: hypothetical protein [unclassified Methylobacterium]KQP61569.1 hypothetical protein ASF39_02530 [Methylobacterium sp. Leaf108]KQT19720.1 hypothetical protein ASG40_02540 [Methylobacterium sp. Leaf399]